MNRWSRKLDRIFVLNPQAPFIRAIDAFLAGSAALEPASSILYEAEERHGVSFLLERPAAIPEGIVDEGSIASALVPFFHETQMLLAGDDAQEFVVVFGHAMEDDYMTFNAWAWYVALWANLECPKSEGNAWTYPEFFIRNHAERVVERYRIYAGAFAKAIELKCAMYAMNVA
jgi:hypothetical protein